MAAPPPPPRGGTVRGLYTLLGLVCCPPWHAHRCAAAALASRRRRRYRLDLRRSGRTCPTVRRQPGDLPPERLGPVLHRPAPESTSPCGDWCSRLRSASPSAYCSGRCTWRMATMSTVPCRGIRGPSSAPPPPMPGPGSESPGPWSGCRRSSAMPRARSGLRRRRWGPAGSGSRPPGSGPPAALPATRSPPAAWACLAQSIPANICLPWGRGRVR